MPPCAKSRAHHNVKVRERTIRVSRTRYHAMLVSKVLEAMARKEGGGVRLLDIECGDKTTLLSLKVKEVIGLDLQNIFYKRGYPPSLVSVELMRFIYPSPTKHLTILYP